MLIKAEFVKAFKNFTTYIIVKIYCEKLKFIDIFFQNYEKMTCFLLFLVEFLIQIFYWKMITYAPLGPSLLIKEFTDKINIIIKSLASSLHSKSKIINNIREIQI